MNVPACIKVYNVARPMPAFPLETVECLLRALPAAVPGVAFLSGGQSGELASARESHESSLQDASAWALAFSYGRSIQEPTLEIWHGDPRNVAAAQQAL